MDNIWAIVLAAGSSSRMGKPKMLLPFQGKTIIETVVLNIKLILNKNILVVLGSNNEEISKQIHKLQVKTCFNNNYPEGMLSSIICGINRLPENVKAFLIFLGDQPQIPDSVARQVINSWKNSKKGIAIPIFNGKRGHPVLIDAKYKTKIQKLDPKQGLRQLMTGNKNDILEVECEYPEILRDIDTPKDYQNEITNKTN